MPVTLADIRAAMAALPVSALWIASDSSSRLKGLTRSASPICSAAPAKRDRIRTPGSAGSWAATYSLATRFMPSRSAVISMTSAAEYRPSSCSNGTGRWM